MTGAGSRSTRAAFVLLATALLMGCAPAPQVPAVRSVNFGFENVVQDTQALRGLAAKLDRSGATRIAVSAGRPEWSAFPWEGHESYVATAAKDRDLVAGAIDVLRPGRSVTIMVDMLAPATVEANPELAGQNPQGESSTEFLSVSAITEGEYAQRAVDFVSAIAARYQPDAIGITELMFDDFTFGEPDLLSYQRYSSNDDWPRTDSGDIDVADSTIADWRSAAIAGLVKRMAEASHAHGVKLSMDVRANFDSPMSGRRESGHDYSLLLEHADSLEVWAYVGLDAGRDGGGAAPDVAALTRDLVDGFGQDRVTISVGLWGNGSETISAGKFKKSLEEAQGGGATSVSVTPASLLTSAQWKTLNEVWAS